jgi:hypothetical protein
MQKANAKVTCARIAISYYSSYYLNLMLYATVHVFRGFNSTDFSLFTEDVRMRASLSISSYRTHL